MSMWRLFMRELAARGPLPTPGDANESALEVGKRLGFITSERRRRGVATMWSITALGREFLAGRVTVREARCRPPHGVYPVATWLRALPPPGAVRIGPPPGVDQWL